MNKGALKIRVNLDTKEYDKQLNNLSTQIKQKQAELQRLYNLQNTVGSKTINGKKYDYSASIRKTELELEKLKNSYISLDAKANPTIEKQEYIWSKLTSKIKRFGLALFSIRGIYALVSRASSQYLAMDTELAEKLSSVWKGLGSFLAPVLEYISNALLKAIGYLNEFIKALTGIDFIAKANAKAIKSQASAIKELNKQMLGFDEVNAFSSTSSGGGSSSTSGLINIPELDENVIKKLQEMAKWLKENWGWIKAVGEILLVVFGVAKIGKILKGISTLMGTAGTAAKAGTGLLGLNTILMALAAGFLIYIAAKGVKQVIDQIKELNKQYDALNTLQDRNNEIVDDLADQTAKLSEEGKLNQKQINNVAGAYKNQIDTSKDLIKKMQEEKSWVGALTGENGRLKDSQQEEYKAIQNTIDKYADLSDRHLLDEQGEEEYRQTLFDTITYLQNAGANADDLKNKYEKLTGRKWQVDMEIHTKEILTQSISQAADKFLFSVFGTKKLATGGIVNNPGKGVNLGNVITGEAGREGVIPLTDASAMEELGASIGRYITINNVIDNYMDSRRINRVMAQSKSTSDFASNK